MTSVINNNESEIYVSWEKDIWSNPANNYSISLCHNAEDNKLPRTIVCKGTDLPKIKDVTYCYNGEWVADPKYGKQFNVKGYTESHRNTEQEIIAYLSSDLVKGIGKTVAKRIYKEFGDRTFYVLENTPEKLLNIKGITMKKYSGIIESLENNRLVSKIYETLKSYSGVTVKLCKKIYDKFGTDSMNVIMHDTYRLCWIDDIGFITADRIARANNLPLDGFDRFAAAAKYVLVTNEIDGNLAMDLQDFGVSMQRTLATSLATPEFINANTAKLIREHKIIYKHVHTDQINVYYVYRPSTYKAERCVADGVLQLMAGEKNEVSQIDGQIAECEKKYHITADPVQISAIKMALKEPFSVITGGPGTGKTTIMRIIIDIYRNEHEGNEVVLMAPTGRASRRLSESTCCGASTIHSRLKLRCSESAVQEIFGNEGVDDDDEPEIYNSLVVIDETSMVDVWVAAKCFEYIKNGCTVIFVGDPGQLQSVGPGAVLRDLIESGVVPVTNLQRIFRQDDGSVIAENAEKIRNGDVTVAEGSDFKMADIHDSEILEKEMIKAYLKAVREYGLEEVACLCPVKDYAAGVYSMNRKLQELVNPPASFNDQIKVGTNIYRTGDLVMELKNGDETMNGDVGIIKKVVTLPGAEFIEVEYFHDTTVRYKKEEFDRLTLAYAMTVHKAQGSEYKCVITCMQDSNRRTANRELVNTVVSRGREMVEFYGSISALKRAILNDIKWKRKTLLCHELRIGSAKELVYTK